MIEHVDYQQIMNKYMLRIKSVEEYGAVKKVSTDQGDYALKQTRMDFNAQKNFIESINSLYRNGFYRIVPIIQTMNKEIFVSYGDSIFYVMPWYNHIPEETTYFSGILREVAKLHAVSSKKIELDRNMLRNRYDQMQNVYDKQQLQLEKFIDKCEKKVYMSPFELLFCSSFKDMMSTIGFSRQKFDEWYNNVIEKENVRVVINHGKLRPSHFVVDQRNKIHLINFEHCCYAEPVYDLSNFYRYVFYHQYQVDTPTIDSFTTYCNHVNFSPEDKQLFACYLTQAHHFCKVVHLYESSQEKVNEIDYVKKLQLSMITLRNLYHFALKLDEMDEFHIADEHGSPQVD